MKNNNFIPEDEKNIIKSYNQFLEDLKIEFGRFLHLSEKAKTNSKTALVARQYSIHIRNLLKNNFRSLSILLDKYRKKRKTDLNKDLKNIE